MMSRRVAPEKAAQDLPAALAPYAGAPLGLVERACQLICEVSIVALAVIVLTEIVTRNVFNFSFQISDEVGGYIIIGLTFLALPVCQARRAYHHVMFLQVRLPPRLREVVNLGFDLLALGFCAILVWELTWQAVQTWQTGDIAPTELATPLWIPQAIMPIGCVALALVLVRDIARRLLRLRRGDA